MDAGGVGDGVGESGGGGVKQLVISLLAMTMINLSYQLGNLADCSLPHNSSQTAASRPKGLQRHTRRRSLTHPPARRRHCASRLLRLILGAAADSSKPRPLQSARHQRRLPLAF